MFSDRQRSVREKKMFGNFARRPESLNNQSLIDHNLNSNSNSKENEIRRFAENGQPASEISSDNNLNRLSGEFNKRITEKLNGLFDNGNVQIQRAN